MALMSFVHQHPGDHVQYLWDSLLKEMVGVSNHRTQALQDQGNFIDRNFQLGGNIWFLTGLFYLVKIFNFANLKYFPHFFLGCSTKFTFRTLYN